MRWSLKLHDSRLQRRRLGVVIDKRADSNDFSLLTNVKLFSDEMHIALKSRTEREGW